MHRSDEEFLNEGIELAAEEINEKVNSNHGHHAYILNKLHREFPGHDIDNAEHTRKYTKGEKTESHEYQTPKVDRGIHKGLHTKIQFHHTSHPETGKSMIYGRVTLHHDEGRGDVARFSQHGKKIMFHNDRTSEKKVMSYEFK